MKRWFAKYPYELKTHHALKMIHKKIHEIRHLEEEEKDYLDELKKLKEMVEDLIEVCEEKASTLPVVFAKE